MGKPGAAWNNAYLTAFFPGTKNDAITALLWSVNYEGDLLADWNTMKTRLESVVMRRHSSDPRSEKYDFFVSNAI